MRFMLKSKIHRATVTSTNLSYGGSVTIAKDLMEKADILPYEQVAVLNLNNGERFETYAIPGELGKVCLNGACARLGEEGDRVIILSYEIMDTTPKFPIWEGRSPIWGSYPGSFFPTVVANGELKPLPPISIIPIIVYVDDNNAIIQEDALA